MSVPLEDETSPDAAVFKDANVLTNAEVHFMLERYMQAKKEKDPTFVPPVTLQKTIAYVSKFKSISNPMAAVEIRRILEKHDLKGYELATIVNLAPETVEEAARLLPSLLKDEERFQEHDIEAIINDMTLYKSWE